MPCTFGGLVHGLPEDAAHGAFELVGGVAGDVATQPVDLAVGRVEDLPAQGGHRRVDPAHLLLDAEGLDVLGDDPASGAQRRIGLRIGAELEVREPQHGDALEMPHQRVQVRVQGEVEHHGATGAEELLGEQRGAAPGAGQHQIGVVQGASRSAGSTTWTPWRSAKPAARPDGENTRTS